MKRSEINKAIRDAQLCFKNNGWALPPNPQWDVTDFGLGNFQQKGLVLVNLASEEEYCEKLMYAYKHQITPEHFHKVKKEDIICRAGVLAVVLWSDFENNKANDEAIVKINGESRKVVLNEPILLEAGERVTILPLQWHSFYPISDECIIGEVSTANDDVNDNFFLDKEVGRYPDIEENEDRYIKLLNE